ncbi:hypothetical protein, partial [Mycobacterium intracellulare]
QTGIGGKNDHVVDQSGLTTAEETALSAFFPPYNASLFRALLGPPGAAKARMLRPLDSAATRDEYSSHDEFIP